MGAIWEFHFEEAHEGLAGCGSRAEGAGLYEAFDLAEGAIEAGKAGGGRVRVGGLEEISEG